MDEFNPVLFDPKAHAARKREESPAFCDAYDALDDEFAALAVLLKTRKDAGLTQAEVATKKGGFPARAGTHRIQPRQPQTRPSLSTLRKYASACGKRLVIQMQ